MINLLDQLEGLAIVEVWNQRFPHPHQSELPYPFEWDQFVPVLKNLNEVI